MYYFFFLFQIYIAILNNLLKGKDYDKIAKIVVDSSLYNLDLEDSTDFTMSIGPNARMRWACRIFKVAKKKNIEIYLTQGTSPHFGNSHTIVILNNDSILVFGQIKQDLPSDLNRLSEIFYHYVIDFQSRGFCFDGLINNMDVGTGFYDIPKKRYYLCEEKCE